MRTFIFSFSDKLCFCYLSKFRVLKILQINTSKNLFLKEKAYELFIYRKYNLLWFLQFYEINSLFFTLKY